MVSGALAGGLTYAAWQGGEYGPRRGAQAADSTINTFDGVLPTATISPGVERNRNYGATAGVTRFMYPGPQYSGPQTLIHETFHIGPYNSFSDIALAKALGVPYQVGRTLQQTTDNASAAWNKKLEEACPSGYRRVQ